LNYCVAVVVLLLSEFLSVHSDN